MKKHGCRASLFVLILLLLTAGPVHAGGLWLTLQPTPDMGVGGAGSQAAGFDASTATANPAAMTRLDRSQLKINMTIPAQLALGAYQAFTDKLALVGTVNWQNWSKFGAPEIAVADSSTVTADLDYQDT